MRISNFKSEFFHQKLSLCIKETNNELSKNYKTLLNVAVPSGMWQKMTDIICNEEDRKYLKKIRKNIKI